MKFYYFIVHLLFAASALADRLSGGAPSVSYGVPPVRNGGGGGNGGYSYDGELLGAASNLLGGAGGQEDPIASLGANIPGGGVPGQDYPILASVPDTGFLCLDQEFPGYFADTADEAGCQVFHICQFDGRQDSFLCPNGTIFNQQYFVCDWWFNVDCAASDQFLGLNAEIGRIPEDSLTGAASNQVPSANYGAPGGPSSNFGGQGAPSTNYGAPGGPSGNFGGQGSPSTSYGAPGGPSGNFGGQGSPSTSYGTPEAQGSVQAPNQLYDTPSRG